MTEETKAAMEEGYDMMVELMDFIIASQSTAPMTEDARQILNDARGVLDLINDELYKTL